MKNANIKGNKMRIGSLFSGIGGFDKAFHDLGAEISWAVEIDKDCRRVLEHHFPNTEIHEDVKTVCKHNLAAVDLICGGFPCQDLSVAGKRVGLAGERSGLWFEFIRIIRELAPKWVFIENVPGLLSSDGGRDFHIILQGLAKCGYLSAWRVLDAQYFGVPQRRRRVFIVASLGSGDCAQVLFESSCGCGNPAPCREKGERVAGTTAPCLSASGRGTSRCGESRGQDPLIVMPINTMAATRPETADHCHAVAIPDPAYAVSVQGSKFGSGRDGQNTFVCYENHAQDSKVREIDLPNITAEAGTGGNNLPLVQQVQWASYFGDHESREGLLTAQKMQVRRLTPKECLRLQGFPDDWLDLDPPLSDSAKYRMCGNAVAVPCIKWIANRILKCQWQGKQC